MILSISIRRIARVLPRTSACLALGVALALTLSVGACSGQRPAMTRYVWMPTEDLQQAAIAESAETPGAETISEEWITGPAGQIATAHERERFADLQSAAEREAFVERFWARRDPAPDSAHNEFRQEFVRRLQAADTAFSTDKQSGSRTLFGVALLVLGFPYEVAVNPHEEGGGLVMAGSLSVPAWPRGGDEVIWRYVPDGVTAVPAGAPNALNQLRVVQFGYTSGAWRMTCGGSLAAQGWAGPARFAGIGGGYYRQGSTGSSGGGGSTPVNYDAFGLAGSSSGGTGAWMPGRAGAYAFATPFRITSDCFSFLLSYSGI